MSFDDELAAIRRGFFYLFDQYGFQVVFTKEFRPDHYSIGLESKTCRLLFYRELGGWSMFFGTLEASFDSEVHGWANIYSLVTFLRKKDIDWGDLSKLPYEDQVYETLYIISRELQPLCQELITMFESAETLAKWEPAFNEYVKEKVRQRFGRP